MNWLHGVYFHSWHFIYQQAQLTVWFGNIVAGIVVYIVVNICWQWFGKKLFHKAMDRIHQRNNAELHEKLDHIIKHSKDIPEFKSKISK